MAMLKKIWTRIDKKIHRNLWICKLEISSSFSFTNISIYRYDCSWKNNVYTVWLTIRQQRSLPTCQFVGANTILRSTRLKQSNDDYEKTISQIMTITLAVMIPMKMIGGKSLILTLQWAKTIMIRQDIVLTLVNNRYRAQNLSKSGQGWNKYSNIFPMIFVIFFSTFFLAHSVGCSSIHDSMISKVVIIFLGSFYFLFLTCRFSFVIAKTGVLLAGIHFLVLLRFLLVIDLSFSLVHYIYTYVFLKNCHLLVFHLLDSPNINFNYSKGFRIIWNFV